MSIDEYFESVKDYILADSSVADLKVIKQVNRSNNGRLRARIRFLDDSVLEFSEFIEKSSGNEIQLVTYSYHWANAQNTLLRRWDNTPHFPQWENTPIISMSVNRFFPVRRSTSSACWMKLQPILESDSSCL